MRKLFASRRFSFIKRDMDGNIQRAWNGRDIDITAKVVCKPCNEGWMSNLENRHAKEAMTDLIIGDKDFTISHMQAQAVARFAFKTAIVVDHMKRDGDLFFPRSVRHQFKHSLKIPRNVQMWLCGYLPMGSGNLLPFWYEKVFSTGEHLKMYVCTYSVGHFVFQAVCADVIGVPSFSPHESFEYLSIPFWPTLPSDMQWPPADVLRTKQDFERFAGRWEKITLASA